MDVTSLRRRTRRARTLAPLCAALLTVALAACSTAEGQATRWDVSPARPVTQPLPPQAPTKATGQGRYPWHTGIVSTTFWVGELYDASLADGSQVCSTYDGEWAYRWSGVSMGRVPASAPGCGGAIWGGCDGNWDANFTKCSTEPRTAANDFFPTNGLVPKENPFYLDLPYDDLNDPIGFARRCEVIPWANDPGYSGRCADRAFSYMKNRWVELVGPNGRTCYGQVQDAGPSSGSQYHDAEYVFGANDARPAQQQWNNAGMDVSPALNGCLGFRHLDGASDRVNWRFVDSPPPGPWTRVITTSGVNW